MGIYHYDPNEPDPTEEDIKATDEARAKQKRVETFDDVIQPFQVNVEMKAELKGLMKQPWIVVITNKEGKKFTRTFDPATDITPDMMNPDQFDDMMSLLGKILNQLPPPPTSTLVRDIEVSGKVFEVLKAWYDTKPRYDASEAIEAMIKITDIYLKHGFDFSKP